MSGPALLVSSGSCTAAGLLTRACGAVRAGKFNELVYQYPIRIPERFSLVIRSLLTQEGICLTLQPDFKFLEVAYPYVAKRLLTDPDPALRSRLIQVLFRGGVFQWKRLENLILLAKEGAQMTAKVGVDTSEPQPTTSTGRAIAAKVSAHARAARRSNSGLRSRFVLTLHPRWFRASPFLLRTPATSLDCPLLGHKHFGFLLCSVLTSYACRPTAQGPGPERHGEGRRAPGVRGPWPAAAAADGVHGGQPAARARGGGAVPPGAGRAAAARHGAEPRARCAARLLTALLASILAYSVFFFQCRLWRCMGAALACKVSDEELPTLHI